MANLTWRNAIEKVLSESGRAMHYKEIAERIVADGLRRNVGATPAATVSAQLAMLIKRNGELSPFVRVGRGQYVIKPASQMTDAKIGETMSPSVESVNDTEEEQYGIVTSFGIWLRARICG